MYTTGCDKTRELVKLCIVVVGVLKPSTGCYDEMGFFVLDMFKKKCFCSLVDFSFTTSGLVTIDLRVM